MESRYGNSTLRKKKGASKSSGGLPKDFLKMVTEVFNNNFDSALKRFHRLKKGAEFVANGEIFPNEVVLSVSLCTPGEISATTAFASIDFDPKASSPKADECLSACVDALGGVYSQILDQADQEQLEQLADESLSALENVPFEWAAVEVDRHQVYVKLDKSNPTLDQMADDWLKKNDPKYHQMLELEEEETKSLFVTGPKSSTKKDPGQLH